MRNASVSAARERGGARAAYRQGKSEGVARPLLALALTRRRPLALRSVVQREDGSGWLVAAFAALRWRRCAAHPSGPDSERRCGRARRPRRRA